GKAVGVTAPWDTDCVVVNTSINSDAIANPSVLLPASGQPVFSLVSFCSGQDAEVSTPLAGWTKRAAGVLGAASSALMTYDTIGTADVTAGWTEASDDAVAVAVLVGQTSATVTSVTSLSNEKSRKSGGAS